MEKANNMSMKEQFLTFIGDEKEWEKHEQAEEESRNNQQFTNAQLWEQVENGEINEGDVFSSDLHDLVICFNGIMFYDLFKYQETGEIDHVLFEKGDQWELVGVYHGEEFDLNDLDVKNKECNQ